MTSALAALATIEDANARYGRVLLPALLIVIAALWAANRPVKVRQPRPPRTGPGLFAGLGGLLWGNLAARAAGRRTWPSQPASPPVRRQTGLDTRPAVRPRRGGPPMPALRRPLSPRYRAYIDGQVPGDSGEWGGWYWPEKRTVILAWYAQRYGPRCLLGIVCGGSARATQLDHCGRAAGYPSDYAELFRETPATTRPVCADCHVRRTELQRDGIDAWQWGAAR